MGTPQMPKLPPPPPPAPEPVDDAVLEARRRSRMKQQAASGRQGTLLAGRQRSETLLGKAPTLTGVGG
jgi:hypothetical protein